MDSNSRGSRVGGPSDSRLSSRTSSLLDGNATSVAALVHERKAVERKAGSQLHFRTIFRPFAASWFFASVLPRAQERGLSEHSAAFGECLGGRLHSELVRIMGGPDLPRVPVLHNDLREDPFSRLARRPVWIAVAFQLPFD